MAHPNPKNMIDDNIQLVSLPEVALRINQLLDEPTSTAQDIADLISQDAALTIRLLKIVNSSFYNFTSKIETVSKAVSIIGTHDLRDLVMATTIIQKFDSIPADLASPESFWCHNIACATAARTIAKQLKLKNSERFFIAGLLHDIGKLVMYLTSPDLSKQIIELMTVPDVDITQLEEISFGFSHADLGAELIRAWNLPEMLIATTQFHHKPSAANQFQTEVAVVHLANNIANAIEKPFSLDDDIPIKDSTWIMLNLDESELNSLTDESNSLYQETLSLIYHKKVA
ncbi:MAG: HDOD domain-containing protein [Gammaproteobacteria bacterium]